MDLTRRRGSLRWLRWTGWTLGLAAVTWVVGGGWYYADALTAVEEPLSWREPVMLSDLPGAACEDDDLRLDLVGLQAADADGAATGPFATYGTDGETTSLRDVCSGRDIEGATDLRTPLPDDVPDDLGGARTALVDINAFTDPEQAGLPFEQVTITGPIGDVPAWLVPGTGPAADTWVVIVHGRGNTRAEGLRLARVLHDLGHTSLLVSYRNDGTGPATDDGRGRFGLTEWRDLDAAVTFARTQAPERLALAGYSQGGAVIASWLDEAGRADAVDGLLLDSPLLSLRPTLRQQAANRGIPGPLTGPLLLGTRAWTRLLHDLDTADVEHVDSVGDWPEVPTLLLHGDADTTVPVEPSDEVAERLGDRVTYLRLRGVEHVRAANADPSAYAAAVGAWAVDVSP